LRVGGHWLGGRRVDFPQENIYIYIYIYNRSKTRHALPWLSVAGGGVLSFEVGCVLEGISCGGTSSPTARRQKWRGHALSRGGVARIAVFFQTQISLSPRRDPRCVDPSRSQVPQGQGRLPNRWGRAAFANCAITRSVSYGQHNAITVK
jgi:hypothetical protein